MTELCEMPHVAIDAARPIALLADVHANIEALDTVLACLDERGVTSAIVLGDLIGYGASPAACIDRIRSRGFIAIRGNHEDMLIDVSHVERTRALKPSARRALAWTRSELDADQIDYVSSLPLASRLGDDMVAVHGSLVDPRHCYAYIYEFSLGLNVDRLREIGPRPGTLLCFGHTHHPAVYVALPAGPRTLDVGCATIRLDPEHLHLVNPGSVGFARDGDPRASLMIFTPSTRSLECVRLEYDIESAAARIRAAGYDSTLADRLLSAR